MNPFFELFSSPFIIPMICIGFIAILSLFYKTEKMRIIGRLCLKIFLIWLWFVIVDNGIMPATGLDPGSPDYSCLRLFLYIIPIAYIILRMK